MALYYLRELDLLAPLEDYVIKLEQQIHQMRALFELVQGQVEDLKGVGNRLESQRKAFDGTIDGKSALIYRRVQELNLTLKKLKAAKQELKAMSLQCARLREQARTILQTEEKMATTTEQLNVSLNALEKDVQKLKQHEALRKENLQYLKKQVEELDKVQDSIENSVGNLKEQIKTAKGEFSDWTHTTEILQGHVYEMDRIDERLKTRNAELSSTVEETQEVIKGIDETAKKIQRLEKIGPLLSYLKDPEIKAIAQAFLACSDAKEKKKFLDVFHTTKIDSIKCIWKAKKGKIDAKR